MEIQKEYYRNGMIAEITVLRDGKKYGLRQDFHPTNGRLSSSTEYLDENEESWIYRSFYPRGTLHLQIPMLNKKRHGTVKTWSEEGVLLQISEFKNDNREGMDRHFFASGKKKAEIDFKNDMLHGFYKEWNEKGDLLLFHVYEKGKRVLLQELC